VCRQRELRREKITNSARETGNVIEVKNLAIGDFLWGTQELD